MSEAYATQYDLVPTQTANFPL